MKAKAMFDLDLTSFLTSETTKETKPNWFVRFFVVVVLEVLIQFDSGRTHSHVGFLVLDG